jgi:hypothetical protein
VRRCREEAGRKKKVSEGYAAVGMGWERHERRIWEGGENRRRM